MSGQVKLSFESECQLKDVQSIKLADFVISNTRLFFERLERSQNFLNKDPQEWNADEDYIRAKQFLSNLRVMNDVARRGVELIEQYNSILTTDEEQKVVEDHHGGGIALSGGMSSPTRLSSETPQ
jgi:hypothetical protein